MHRRVLIPFLTFGLLLGPRVALAQGTLLWRQTLNGTASGDDKAWSVAVDTQGNVLAAGTTVNTGTSGDFTVAKFDPDGTRLWLRTINGTANGGDVAHSVAVDTQGNVFVAGYTFNTGTSGDFTVAKFDPDGTRLWLRTINGTANGGDGAQSVAVDTQGNVLVAGAIWNGRADWDFTVAKFDPDGTLLWLRTINGPGDDDDVAESVAVDTDGNVIAAGYILNFWGWDFTVMKFARDGSLLWERHLGGGPNDYAESVAVDTEGNVFAAGVTDNTSPPHSMVAKFARDGTLLWQQIPEFSVRAFVAVDTEGNAFASGNGTGRDFTVAKFARDGTVLWQQVFNTGPNDSALSVAVDTEGNVFAAGDTYIPGASTLPDFMVAKFAGVDDTPWNVCAPEGGVCAFTGTTEVRYGADGAFVLKTLTDGTACTNEVFGDPIYGTVKECAIRSTPPPTDWTFCAPEGDLCAFTGTVEVRYGANGFFVFKTLTDGTACTNAVFGDPIFGTVKHCSIPSTPQPEWTFCAPEGGVCSFTGDREVRYGANDSFVFKTLTGGTACTNDVFGDPIYGVVKSCDLRSASESLPQP